MFDYVKNDAGRSNSKRPKQTRDCVVRAFAIASQISYDEAYELFAAAGRKASRSTPKGIWKPIVDEAGEKTSFPAIKGQPRMSIGAFGAKYPKGRWFVQLAGHIVAVIDGKVYDDAKPRSTRCVYAAWKVKDS